MTMWWYDVTDAAGLEWEIHFKKIDALRVERGLLPIRALRHEFAGPPAQALYDYDGIVKGEPVWYLKPEFADLIHKNPYRAPHNLRELYIKLVAKRMNNLENNV